MQSVRSGDLRLVEIPTPSIGPTEVLVETTVSLVSAGTERAARKLASANLLEKARARPDLVRQVARKAKADGLRPTIRALRSRLDEELPLGYSAAGTVVQVGEAVAGVRPGDRVATGGAGHAELQVVSGLLVARTPDGVDDASSAFATVGSIALHALRLADVGPGARIAVLGLGLVGQLTGRLALAAGCEVAGIDVRTWMVERAVGSSAELALLESGPDTTEAISAWTRGQGVDAVIVTAATKSSDPMRRAPDLARDRATIVLVGDVGLDLDRRPLYEKELSIKVARSYGPGRYELSYEQWGVDYPPGQVRWTEGRNLAAFLGLLDRGRVRVDDLITHQFAFDDALAAYELLESDEPHLGVELTYPGSASERRTTVQLRAPRAGTDGVGLIGAGAFARATLVPALKAAGFERFVSVASASGLSARRLAERDGFERVAASAEAVISDPDVSVVVIATPHDTHAALAAAALLAHKHVLCEKPLALTAAELDEVEDAWRGSGCQLFVGFNRRFSPAVAQVRQQLSAYLSPAVISYRVNAGTISPDHWYSDRRQGGRLLGEVCHFVDTSAAIAGTPIAQVAAFCGGQGELIMGENVVVALRFLNGALATISYASGGHRDTAKERVQVMCAGHTLTIDDYRSVTVDGSASLSGAQDKGHNALVSEFARAVRGTTLSTFTEMFISSSRATLAAVDSAAEGRQVTAGDD